MKKLFVLLLFLSGFLFGAPNHDSTAVALLDDDYNWQVWGNEDSLELGAQETLYVYNSIEIGRYNIFAVELINGDSTVIDYTTAALTTDWAMKPTDWRALPVIKAAETFWFYGWTEDTTAFDVHIKFRIRELNNSARDDIFFRFKQHTY